MATSPCGYFSTSRRDAMLRAWGRCRAKRRGSGRRVSKRRHSQLSTVRDAAQPLNRTYERFSCSVLPVSVTRIKRRDGCWEHINLTRYCIWHTDKRVAKGGLGLSETPEPPSAARERGISPMGASVRSLLSKTSFGVPLLDEVRAQIKGVVMCPLIKPLVVFFLAAGSALLAGMPAQGAVPRSTATV